MSRLRARRGVGKRVRVGAPDPSLTGVAGLVAVAELADAVGLVTALDDAVPGFKARRRGAGPGWLLTSLAAAQLAGADHLTGMDARRRDAVAEELVETVLGAGRWPASTTVTGLARRIDDVALSALTAATAAVTATAIGLAPVQVRQRLRRGPVTIDLDCTDIEVYGRKKQQITYNYLGQRSGRVHAALWAEAGVLTDIQLTHSRVTPHTSAPQAVQASLTWLAQAGVDIAVQRPRVRADIGYCSATLAAAIVAAGADFAFGQQRQPKIWALLERIPHSAWTAATAMPGAQVAAIDYPYRGWPDGTRVIVRRVRHDAATISPDHRARRRRTVPADQLALALNGDLDTVYGYSFILTNLPTTTAEQAVAVEYWHRCRTDIEAFFKQAKHGAALRHLPSGDPAVNAVWVHAAALAVAFTAWLHLLLDCEQPGALQRRTLTTWRRELINIPARLVRHARTLTLRPAPDSLLPAVLARLRTLPALT